jgi:hypothetical protein
MYIGRMKFFNNLKATFKNRFKKRKNNNNATRKRGEKSFEEVMAILKEIKKLYDDNNIKVIEDARKRQAPKHWLPTKYKTLHVWSDTILLKDRGISDIYKYSKSNILNHVRTDEEQKIMNAHRSITKAEQSYMCRNPTQYPGVAKMAKKDPTQCDPDYF